MEREGVARFRIYKSATFRNQITMHTEFSIQTNGPGLYEFTDQVADWVTGSGLLTLFIRHTSCSLLIQENADPDVQRDLQAFFINLCRHLISWKCIFFPTR